MFERRILPQRRADESFELHHGKSTFHVTIGRYSDGAPGEIFIDGAKVGSEMEAVTRDSAIALSLMMQYGIPLDIFRHAVTREEDGSPSSIIGA